MAIDLSKITDTDLFACTGEDGVTYSVTGAQFKALFVEEMPWDGEAGIYHVILTDPTNISITNQANIYNLANQAQVSSIDAAGEWIVTGANTQFKYSTGNWDFGDLTNTSAVTNMYYMFYDARKFNSDLSMFDVGNVTDMKSMFSAAYEFNQDLSNWDVSNATDMGNMFYSCFAFNQELSSWDVSNVKYMYQMFLDANVFESDLSTKQVTVNGKTYTAWDTSRVIRMDRMFYGAFAFNSDLSNWNVSNVYDMQRMFYDARKFNSDISGWNVSGVKNGYEMSTMFADTETFNQDLSDWCVTTITSAPDRFDEDALAWTGGDATRPQWGTCPRGEDLA